MQCNGCGFENPTRVRFCGGCGASLSQRCRCGAESPAGFLFCGQCGASLSGETPPQPPPSAQPTGTPAAPPRAGAPAGERRQLTVLFCDLVGSTALSEQLDPEELRELVGAYHRVATEAVGRFDGTVAQFLGDGVLVYFGLPTAHEDDARRSVQAALEVVAAVARLNEESADRSGIRLAVRVGVHTGTVVVSEMGVGARRERAAIGVTPMIAAHLSDRADPDGILVSESTNRLVRAFLPTEAAGSHSIADVADPVVAHRVVQEGGIVAGPPAPTPFTPFVGRDQELSLVLERWERVVEGEGQVVLLAGEAGIGKSRLLHELRERLGDAEHVWLECGCSELHQSSALYPVIVLLQRAIGLVPGCDAEARLDRLEAFVRRTAPGDDEAVPLLASMLSIPFESRHALPQMTPQRQKQRLLETLLRLLLALAEERPVVAVIEDLQWIDPSTLELVTLLVERGAAVGSLVLLSCRPTFRSPWPARSNMTQLSLNRLPRRQVEALVGGLIPEGDLPPEVLERVLERADGVPLFAEELAKMVLESDLALEGEGRGDAAGSIPSTLQDSLMARLDRLATVKQVAQAASAIGRHFSYELLRAVAPCDESALQSALEQLTRAELVYPRGVPPHATYLFKHALIREAAYQSLLHSQRRSYHHRLATVLEADFPETVSTQPELLAHHYTEAGAASQAVEYWLRAGQFSIARSGNEEAIAHLRHGLELVPSLDLPEERLQRELALQTTLSVPLTLARGYAAPEAEVAFGRALELSRELGDAPQRFGVLRGLAQFYNVRAQFETSRELAAELARLAEKSAGNSGLMLEAQWMQGAAALFAGRLLEGRQHLDHALSLYDPAQHRGHAFVFGEEPGVAAHLYSGWTTWFLGEPDRAKRHVASALDIAEQTQHPNTLAFARCFAASTHGALLRDPSPCLEHAAAAIRISDEQGFPFWRAFGMMFHGWARTQLDSAAAGLDEIQRGFDEWRATGAELGLSFVQGMLAEVHLVSGELALALELVDDALDALRRHGRDQYWEPELLRLRGEMLRRDGASDDEADACYQRAITVARALASRSLELRAVISASRLLRDRGDVEAARAGLQRVRGGFEEGFETADLREADALLRELAA